MLFAPGIVIVNCPLCEAQDVRDTGLTTCMDKLHLGQYRVYSCLHCHNRFTYPLPPAEDYRLPVDAVNRGGSSRTSFLLDRFLSLRARRIRRALPDGPDGRTLLDVGAGAGGFAREAAAHGFDVVAIEPNIANRPVVSPGPGIKFIGSTFSNSLLTEGLLEEESFDVVTMWHSLEHFENPAAVLLLARKLLKKDGILLISVPDATSLQASAGGNFWVYLDVPNHLVHYSYRGLKTLVEADDLAVRHRYLFSLEYDVYGWLQTLLNLLSRSHNYLYNVVKKGRADAHAGPYPWWTKTLFYLSPAVLPISLICCFIARLLRSPSCIEVICRKR